MFNLYDIVKLKRDRHDVGVKAIHNGTIVDVLAGGTVYTVEFFDEHRETIEGSLFTEFNVDELELVSKHSILKESDRRVTA